MDVSKSNAELIPNKMQKHIRTFLILVLSGLGANQFVAQTTILDQTLLTQASFNEFTAVSVTGAQNWNFSSIYGAVCSGYAFSQNNENDNWFISPTMNLAQVENVVLTFSHTRGSAGVLNVGVAEGWYKAYATSNYTGNTATTQWIELTGLNQSVPTAWTYISSGNLSIPQAAKSANSRIAFRYMSSNTQSATWEIKNVKVVGDLPTSPNTSVFKITNWNTEWLGCASFGPTDENLQLNNVVSALLAMDSDVYCLQEVSNSVATPTIASLISLMGSDVWDGTMVPSTTNDCEQRQAIIYKKAKVQLVSAAQLSSGPAAQGNSYYYNWSSGRFPALYKVNLISGSNIVPVSIVNVHAKAEDGNAASYTRRLGGSEGLKTILDGATYNTQNVVFLGDFNDLLIGTTSNTCNCTDSPYKNYMYDTTNYTGVTQFLNDAHWNRPLIENIILSNELVGNYVQNSAAQEVAVPPSINNYYNTTSDHLPVTARFQFTTLANQQYTQTTTKPLTLYPNPVLTEVHFDTDGLEENVVVTVYDLTGRQMRNEKTTATTINVAALPSGIYILKAGNRFGKFVKE